MSRWKRSASALGALVVTGVLAAVAVGQEGGQSLTTTVKVTSSKAGTPSHPRGIGIVASGTIHMPPDTPVPVARSFDVWLPRGWVYNGAKHPACTAAKLSTGGPAACPSGSIMGGRPGGGISPPDDLNPPPRVTVINGGPTKMYFWTVIQNPARVQVAVPGTVTKVNSPRWSYRVHAEIPSSLQVVAGIPITPDSFNARVRPNGWIATTSCPRDELWHYKLRITSTTGQILETSGSVPCRS